MQTTAVSGQASARRGSLAPSTSASHAHRERAPTFQANQRIMINHVHADIPQLPYKDTSL